MDNSNKQGTREIENENIELPFRMEFNRGIIFHYLYKTVIWVVFFVFFFLLRDLFGLISITFLLGFMMYRINEIICRKVKVSPVPNNENRSRI
jgi:hypothetical protein